MKGDASLVEPLNNVFIMEATNKEERIKKLSLFFSEFFGTFILVFITCMGCNVKLQNELLSSLQASFAGGFAVMATMHIFGHVSSAHVNPAVSLSAVILKQITLQEFFVYVFAQLFGSTASYATLIALTPRDLMGEECVTRPNFLLTDCQAVFVEVLLTMVLMFAVFATWEKKNRDKLDSAALRIGLIVVMLGLAGGGYTGASMNPARSFGPALVTQQLSKHWIYWVGPCFSAVASSVLYKNIFMTK